MPAAAMAASSRSRRAMARGMVLGSIVAVRVPQRLTSPRLRLSDSHYAHILAVDRRNGVPETRMNAVFLTGLASPVGPNATIRVTHWFDSSFRRCVHTIAACGERVGVRGPLHGLRCEAQTRGEAPS